VVAMKIAVGIGNSVMSKQRIVNILQEADRYHKKIINIWFTFNIWSKMKTIQKLVEIGSGDWQITGNTYFSPKKR
jgi:hypothetical protein